MLNYRLYGLEAGIFALLLITGLVLKGNAVFFDGTYDAAVMAMRGPGMNTFMELITYIGNWQSIVIICLLLLIFEKTRKTYGIPVAAAAIISTAINKVMKVIIERPRPDAADMLIHEGGFSFPSGHATTAAAVAMIIAYLLYKNMKNRKLALLYGVLLNVLCIAIAVSRVYLGVHHASDVVAGWCLGASVFCAVSLYFYPYKTEKLKWQEKRDAKKRKMLESVEEVEVEIVDEEQLKNMK